MLAVSLEILPQWRRDKVTYGPHTTYTSELAIAGGMDIIHEYEFLLSLVHGS